MVAREEAVNRNQTEDITEEISEEELRKRWDSVVASLARYSNQHHHSICILLLYVISFFSRYVFPPRPPPPLQSI
jgi:hypothetical protein